MSDPLLEPSLESTPQQRVWNPDQFFWFGFLAGSLGAGIHVLRNSQRIHGEVQLREVIVVLLAVLGSFAAVLLVPDSTASTVRLINRGLAVAMTIVIARWQSVAVRPHVMRGQPFMRWQDGVGVVVVAAIVHGAVLAALASV